MADTQRTRQELQALFLDNQSGQISAQDARDFLMSVYIKPEIDQQLTNLQTTMEAYVIQKTATYIHTQGIQSQIWTINHGLDRNPSVEVIDVNGNQLEGDVVWVNTNQITITFNKLFNGKAYLN